MLERMKIFVSVVSFSILTKCCCPSTLYHTFFTLFAGWPFLQQQHWRGFSCEHQDADHRRSSGWAVFTSACPLGEWPKLRRARKDARFPAMRVCSPQPVTKGTWWIPALAQPRKCICRLLTMWQFFFTVPIRNSLTSLARLSRARRFSSSRWRWGALITGCMLRKWKRCCYMYPLCSRWGAPIISFNLPCPRRWRGRHLSRMQGKKLAVAVPGPPRMSGFRIQQNYNENSCPLQTSINTLLIWITPRITLLPVLPRSFEK